MRCYILQYIVERHAETLLPQYLGMYRVTVNDAETYLVVMKNVFSPRLNIHKKYDLKVMCTGCKCACVHGSHIDWKTWKMGKHFPVRVKSMNFLTHWKSPEILDDF